MDRPGAAYMTWMRNGSYFWGIVMALVLSGCGAASLQLPPPRPIVVHSGARLRPDPDRMAEVDAWVKAENTNIVEDPSFLVISTTALGEAFPWDELDVVSDDSVKVGYQPAVPDISLPYQIYAHLHLMARRGELDVWLPEAQNATGYVLERAIVKRVSDAWLYGRSVFETTPYALLDELVFSVENGYLDAFLFTARPEEFAREREAWVAENPNGLEEFKAWFQETFERLPPGLRANEGPLS